tara:strand:- start:5930 stop:7828 length:1899 start_codon:yes stop_codon:yes gene_type:complete
MAVNPQKYSIYAQKNLEKEYVDWGKVAQDVTKGITTIAADRAARKAALDEETQKAMENLSAVPDVQNQDAGGLIINASDMSKKNLQIQYDLLKRGLISPKDFKLYMQQQKNGYASYSDSIKNWDTWYQKSLERQEIDANGNIIASEGELYNTTALESFGNLKNKVLMTNPANGQLQLVEMDKDGDGNFTVMPDVTENPQRIINPHGINQRMNMRSNRKVLNDEAKKLVDPLGQVIKSYVSEKGTGFTKEGFRYADGKTYEDFLVDAENTLTATNDDQMQILAGVGYRIAQSEEEFKKKYPGVSTDKMILVSYDSGAPVYSLAKGDMEAEAKKVARAAVDRQVDDMTKTDKEESSTSINQSKEDEKLNVSYEIAYNFASGGEPSSAALAKITANNDEIQNIYSDDTQDAFVIQYTDGREPKVIKKQYTKDKDGKKIYDAKETAVSLMAAVTPGADVVSAQRARELYKGEDKPFVDDYNVKRTPVDVQSSGTGFLNRTKSEGGKIVPVSISEALTEIDPDEDSASLYQDLFKSLGVEKGTEYLLENIKVVPSPRSTGTDDVLRFYLPPEVMGLIDKTDIVFSGDAIPGEDYMEVSVEELDTGGSDAGIKYIIDKILIASNNAYNNPSGSKPKGY